MDLQGLMANNLGGKGPDFQADKGIRFKHVAADNAQSVDLLVTVDPESFYEPQQGAALNGLQGDFGNVFLERDSETVLQFELVDSVTSDAMVFEDLVLKFFDSDSGVEGSDISTYSIEALDECEAG